MEDFQVLVVAGTHGNEINAPWLFEKWWKDPQLCKKYGLKVHSVIGNPKAYKSGIRYIDRDLNRSFSLNFLNSSISNQYEVNRANELFNMYGIGGNYPCKIALDFHSTTSSMGSCLVIYGRRPADLALASLIQFRLGLPIYLHESDEAEHGFLVERWPCGIVVEIGPVPQGLLLSDIVHKNKLIMEVCFEEISKVKSGIAHYPHQIVIHRHLGSLDYPRGENGSQDALIHENIQGMDWRTIKKGSPLFHSIRGLDIKSTENIIPVFINEAAYAEKKISMSLTKKEIWETSNLWISKINKLIC